MSQDVPAAGVGQGGAETVIRKTVASYTYRRSVYEVHQEFGEVHPEQISTACTGWKAAADELLALAEDLKARIAVPLADAWSSPSSPQAQYQLQQAEATARALAADCLQMARATDSAAQSAQWYKANLPSYVEAVATGVKGTVTGKGLTAGAEEAVDHMVKLLHCYNEVIQTLPAAVRSPVAETGLQREDEPFTRRGSGEHGGGVFGAGGVGAAGVGRVGVGSGAGAGLPAVTGSGLAGAAGSAGVGAAQGSGGASAGGRGAGWGGVSGAGSSVDPYAARSSLAGTGLGGGVSGFDPATLGSAAGGAGSGLGGGLGAGLGAGALGATGLGAGGVAAGLGSGRAGTGLGTGAGSGVFGGPGAGGAGVGGVVGQSGSASGVGRGAGMVPLHGAGGRGEGAEERQRSSWLTEDDDVWGVDESAPPPVITE
jgi:hypothetical protein